MHFFTATGELAQKYLDLGCYLSFPGPVTYTDMYDDSVRVTPLDRILIETDAPFAAPRPYRGKRNQPAWVAYVAAEVARLRDVPVAAIAAATSANFFNLFKIDPHANQTPS